MSSEIARKRGRPKKVISDPVESEIPETTKKSTTRAKSTKAAASKSSTPKAKTATPAKASVSKPAASSLPPQKATTSKAPSPPVKKPESQTPPPAPAPAKQPPKTPVTPETSKILSKVRELSQETIPKLEEAARSSKPSPTNLGSEPVSTPQTNTPPPNPTNISPPKPPPAPKATAPSATKPHVPLASLNSEIVSNISTRAGARPNTAGSRALPPNYKMAARKVTMAIVAAPILIVTSYVLYERLVLGEERKLLVKPLPPVESEQAVKIEAIQSE
ncbi:hypothetical protein LAWI1_G002974 [Lachnellula willkommii]|uniref:Uncharacterized protein n=1 Tax=Lachnellula willkommii TaxID=215461 RepID=A0A559MA20_9HELO|nr:hypothetical protein LAWI1_G002974 [Lachnellula willkommii]